MDRMAAERRHRIARCLACEAVVPYRKRNCARCGYPGRRYSLASGTELELARTLQGAALGDLIVPRGWVEPADRRPLVGRFVDAIRERARTAAAVFQRR